MTIISIIITFEAVLKICCCFLKPKAQKILGEEATEFDLVGSEF